MGQESESARIAGVVTGGSLPLGRPIPGLGSGLTTDAIEESRDDIVARIETESAQRRLEVARLEHEVKVRLSKISNQEYLPLVRFSIVPDLNHTLTYRA